MQEWKDAARKDEANSLIFLSRMLGKEVVNLNDYGGVQFRNWGKPWLW